MSVNASEEFSRIQSEIYHHGYDRDYKQGKSDVREEVIDECLNALCNNCKCADECLGYCQHYKALEKLKEQKYED